ncbi:succinate dehydrogenase assembly factor 4, mitochondrial [Carica papaya]|uniref:succinate dehydrogenase assembly factor 4, mitochondrial n=1 Tax=Carica papaya TaxID=3649 RepID=UPI000B8D1072|nr:succinate dehydrogenase assembly factor 4, mitochondrial [Carica papaya]
MARSNLGRIFSSISDLSTPKINHFVIPPVSRLVFSSAPYSQIHPRENTEQKQQEDSFQGKLPNETQEDQRQDNEEDDDDDDDEEEYVNKETGETGGPRGPEPTRYGDWELKGRCSDF